MTLRTLALLSLLATPVLALDAPANLSCDLFRVEQSAVDGDKWVKGQDRLGTLTIGKDGGTLAGKLARVKFNAVHAEQSDDRHFTYHLAGEDQSSHFELLVNVFDGTGLVYPAKATQPECKAPG